MRRIDSVKFNCKFAEEVGLHHPSTVNSSEGLVRVSENNM